MSETATLDAGHDEQGDKPGRAVDPGITVKAMTEDDIAKVAKITITAKGEAAMRKRCTFALLMAADMSLPALGEMEAEKVAGLVNAAAETEGTDVEPITVPEDVAGARWIDGQGQDWRGAIEDRMGAIYGRHFAEDEDGEVVAAPVVPARPKATVTYPKAQAPVSIRLTYPITVDGRTIKSVDLLPPAYGDVLAVQAGEMSRHDMTANMIGLPPEALDAMRYPDAERIAMAALDMTPEG